LSFGVSLLESGGLKLQISGSGLSLGTENFYLKAPSERPKNSLNPSEQQARTPNPPWQPRLKGPASDEPHAQQRHSERRPAPAKACEESLGFHAFFFFFVAFCVFSLSLSFVCMLVFGVWGLGFGVGLWGLGFGVWGFGFGVLGFGFRVSGFGFRDLSLGFRA
jgi:hypothetical protein